VPVIEGPLIPPPVPTIPPSQQAALDAVRQARPVPAGPLQVQRLRYEDLPFVLDLVNADQLPGQPACSRHALDRALRGESSVDASWWKELANVQAVVAQRGGVPVGAASFAIAPADRSGWVLWLHAKEDRAVVEALVDHVLTELTRSSHLYAFWIATALTLGVEALPVKQRRVTGEVLQASRLLGRDSWSYLVAPLEHGTIDAGVEELGAVIPTSGRGEMPAWRLAVGDPEQPLARAEVVLGPGGCGALSWLEVELAERGRGIGRRLAQQALRFLTLRGAQTVAAVVAQNEAHDHDRGSVVHLLESVGFREVDRLRSYESPKRRSR
jgi:ribosomal protein S18 acetylase RimI-like enzyme